MTRGARVLGQELVNLLDSLARFFGLKRGDDPQAHSRLSPWPVDLAGLRLSDSQALSLSATWGCVTLLAKSVSQCDWNIYEPIPGTKRRRMLLEDPRYYLLNTEPNPEMTAMAFREGMMLQAVAFGNAYAEIVPDGANRPREIWPLEVDRVTPRRTADWKLFYEYRAPSGDVVMLPPSRVFHLRGPGVSALMGDNVIARAARVMAVAAAQERFSVDFFGRGAQLAGVLELPGTLGEKAHDQLRKEWEENHAGGGRRSFRPLILEAGMKFTSTTVSPKDASLVEDKSFSVEEICRFFGVPPHKIQHLKHATFSNIEHSSIEFVRDALGPWAKRNSQEADRKLMALRMKSEIDLEPLTRGDANSRAQAQASWRQAGIMTANEIRAMEGLDDVGAEGDVLLVQSALTTVKGIVASVDRAALPPPPPPADDEPEPAEPEDEAETVARDVVERVIRASVGRALKRLEHKGGCARAGDGFMAAQAECVRDEVMGFAPFVVLALRREFTRDDAMRMILALEKSPNRGDLLFTTLEIGK